MRRLLLNKRFLTAVTLLILLAVIVLGSLPGSPINSLLKPVGAVVNPVQKAVKYSFSIMLLWLLGTQLILQFTPNANDYINDSLKVVFGLVPRITIASLIGFICSQNIDVFLYHFIWKKTGDNKSKLWLRNNGSTLISQAIDTVIFTFLAFWGTYPTNVFFSILITTYLFKALVAVIDTPFIYIARKINPREE
jgi:uncharacterized integral membrane protein (TIGR00697 family)